jgi:hypothetical protein
MHSMILLRDAGAASPAPELAGAHEAFWNELRDSGVLHLRARFADTSQAVRIPLAHDPARADDPAATLVADGPLIHGPFPASQTVNGFAVIETPDQAAALACLARWPGQEGELELRVAGCPGGCLSIDGLAGKPAASRRFVILLRSSADLEAEVVPPRARLDALDHFNLAQSTAGVLVSGAGLRSTASGKRLKASGGKRMVLDGPFTEIKELIAGYWMVAADSMQEAIAWARTVPYPTGPHVLLELREVLYLQSGREVFTAEMRAAEQRIRERQLEAASHTPLNW